ncbi:hypothetical protein FRB99_005642 [Tulasnella sp. 403]|nr:hypothetical protein FRB99_005642 [Tulasnella sp. 403]
MDSNSDTDTSDSPPPLVSAFDSDDDDSDRDEEPTFLRDYFHGRQFRAILSIAPQVLMWAAHMLDNHFIWPNSAKRFYPNYPPSFHATPNGLVKDRIVSPLISNLSSQPAAAVLQAIRGEWRGTQSLLQHGAKLRLDLAEGITVYVFIWEHSRSRTHLPSAPALYVRVLAEGEHYNFIEDHRLMRHLRRTSTLATGNILQYDVLSAVWVPHDFADDIPIPHAGMKVFIKAEGIAHTPYLFEILSKMHPIIPYTPIEN